MSNPNHDPKTGEFSSGPGGAGARTKARHEKVLARARAQDQLRADKARLKEERKGARVVDVASLKPASRAQIISEGIAREARKARNAQKSTALERAAARTKAHHEKVLTRAREEDSLAAIRAHNARRRAASKY